MELQRVRAIEPFVASFQCAAGDADFIQNELTEDASGNIVTKRVPYKRVIGRVDTVRPATDADKREDAEQQRLHSILGKPFESRLTDDGLNIALPADPPFVEVPPKLAASLVERGLAEYIDAQPAAPEPVPGRTIGTRRMAPRANA